MKRYRVTSGSFRLPDDRIVGTGEIVELPEDLATLHAAQLAEEPSPVALAKAGGTK